MDPPLSDAGRRQTELVGEVLRSIPLQAVYSSPLQRALATAAVVAAPHGLPVVLDAGLREIAFGEWESLLGEEVEQRFGALLQQWWERPDQVQIPGADSLGDVRSRAVDALREIVARHRDARIAVVAHGGVNKLILLTLVGAPLSSFWRLAQSNACVNVVEFDGNRGRVLVVNDTTHLK